ACGRTLLRPPLAPNPGQAPAAQCFSVHHKPVRNILRKPCKTLRIWERTVHLGRLFQRSVQTHHERPALATGASAGIDYAGLDRRIRALAHWMRHELGLDPGERITLAMKNRAEYAELLLASWHAGLCAVPVNSNLHPQEVGYILSDSGSRLCFTDAGLYEGLLPVAEAIEPLRLMRVDAPAYAQAVEGPPADEGMNHEQNGDAPAWLFYTSGTTGRPKGVVLSHANLVNMALNFYADVQAVDHTDVLLHVEIGRAHV